MESKMCVLNTKICWSFHTVGNCKWYFACETSSAMAYHSALPCCLPAVSSRLICSRHFHSGRSSICWGFREEQSRIPSTRCYINRQRIWKALRWHQTSSLAAKTAGNFLCCPPLPIYWQAINSKPVDEGWQQGWWAPILDLSMNGWQNHRSHLFGFWEKGTSWEVDKTSPFYWTHVSAADSATTQLAADREHC